MYTKSLITFGMFLLPSLAAPAPELQDRNNCHGDNILRALERFSASASPFCSAFISIAPTSTVYVTTPIPTPTTTINPTVLPSYVSQYNAAQVSSACSCLSIPPSVATLPAIPDASCDNQGLAFAVQSHTFYNSVPYSSLDVEYFKTAQPVQTGFTTRIGFFNQITSTPFSIYGGEPIVTEYKAVNHRGYFVPPVSGEYTITSDNTDDIALAWLGPSAFNGAYSRAGASLEQNFGAIGTESYKVVLVAGDYYPFRVLVVNGQGPASFALKVVGPTGEVLVSPTSTEPTPWFVQYSCNGKSPAFEPFGAEF